MGNNTKWATMEMASQRRASRSRMYVKSSRFPTFSTCVCDVVLQYFNKKNNRIVIPFIFLIGIVVVHLGVS